MPGELLSTPNDVGAIADLAQRAIEPTELVDDVVGVFVPDGARFEVVELERHLPRPKRARGTVTLDDANSLAAYVGRHGEPDGRSALYADVDSARVVAVLNGHAAPPDTGWGDHRATLTLRHSLEWQRWAPNDRKYLDQVTFAELVEEGIDDVIDPPAAELLELALTFEAKTAVNFKQGANLSDGSRQLIYEEQVDARGGSRGELVIPKTFTLRLRPFDGGDAVPVTVRLRFRIREGRLSIGDRGRPRRVRLARPGARVDARRRRVLRAGRSMTATVVDGKKVIADEGAPSPVGNGLTFKSIRTLLLDDGSTIFGCVDCDYTAEKTGSVRSHRVKHAKKPRRPAVGSKSSTVVGLARELERLSSELEQVGEDRDRWKARATKAERSLETLRRALRAD